MTIMLEITAHTGISLFPSLGIIPLKRSPFILSYPEIKRTSSFIEDLNRTAETFNWGDKSPEKRGRFLKSDSTFGTVTSRPC